MLLSQGHEILTPKEAAEYLRLSPETLRQWRHLGEGPKYLKPGRSVKYRKCDIMAWLDEITVAPKRG